MNPICKNFKIYNRNVNSYQISNNKYRNQINNSNNINNHRHYQQR